MIYLSGAVRPEIPGIGFMLTPNMGNKLPAGRIWAADNGRWAAPQLYTDESFLSWLAARDPTHCLFATAPDVVADHAATLELSRSMLPRIRRVGYKVAFVAQDGWDDAPWDEFDCVFIGGTTAFKLGQQIPPIVAKARRCGKWVHMGRVNSLLRMRYAQAIGCHSVDGTFLKFGPDTNTPRLLRWLEEIRQPFLDLYGVYTTPTEQ